MKLGYKDERALVKLLDKLADRMVEVAPRVTLSEAAPDFESELINPKDARLIAKARQVSHAFNCNVSGYLPWNQKGETKKRKR